MAIFKGDRYSNSNATIEVKTGDDDFDVENEEMLQISGRELIKAINAEGLCDKIFGRIMTDRTKKHAAMMQKIPGVGE